MAIGNMTITKTQTELKPQDFIAPIYAAVIDELGRAMLPRPKIIWGQQVIDFPVTETGWFTEVKIFDRPEGGEPFDVRIIFISPSSRIWLEKGKVDTFHLTVHWTF